MKKKTDVLVLTQMALLMALMLVLSFTPLGYVRLFVINATTMHIPVILGACMLGPKYGGVLGGFFGVTSVIRATMEPNLTSFVFSPFYSVGDAHGNAWSLVVAILPRILIGIAAGYLFRALSKTKLPQWLSLGIAGLVGSLVNTIGVMGLIYICFGQQYAAAQNLPYSALFGAIIGVVFTIGVPEAIVAAVLNTAVGKVLLRIFRRTPSAVSTASVD